jgi:hypothetical protein
MVEREIDRRRRADDRKSDAAPVREIENYVVVKYGTPPDVN